MIRNPLASIPSSTAAGGAAPAVITCTLRSSGRLSASGALRMKLSTIGAPQKWVTPSPAIAA